MLRQALFSGIVAQVAFAAFSPAHAIYNGPKNSDPAIGAWISSLRSDFGRCCDEADSLSDVYWESSATASSGYAIEFQGKKIDVDARAMKIREPDPTVTGSYRPIEKNLAGIALAWMTPSYYDGNHNPVFDYDLNGNPTFHVTCLIPGAGN